MKYFTVLFVSLLFSNNTFATNLCDASCEIIINFPDGGSIHAIEAMTITFGTGGSVILGATGTVNTNPQPITMDFSSGGSLQLAEGDSITFDENGRLFVGSDGNINATNLLISFSGDSSFTAIGGEKTIQINDFTLVGRGHILFEATTITVNGSLIGETGSTLSFLSDASALETMACSIQDINNNVSISAGTVITQDNTCSSLSSDLNLSSGVISEGSLATLNLNLDTDTTITNIDINPIPLPTPVGPIVVEIATQELLESLADGITLTAEDGNSCTMFGGECITTSGNKYIVVEGKIVPETSGSGLMNPIHFLILFIISLIINHQSSIFILRKKL